MVGYKNGIVACFLKKPYLLARAQLGASRYGISMHMYFGFKQGAILFSDLLRILYHFLQIKSTFRKYFLTFLLPFDIIMKSEVTL